MKIPQQEKGSQHDAVSKYCFEDEATAKIAYDALRLKLKDINNWHKLAENISAKFSLVKDDGSSAAHIPEAGFYIKNNIPGPGNKAGGGYDWVRIIKVYPQEEEPIYGFTVSPVSNPLNDDDDLAHFYDADATNTFLVRRKEKCVYAEVHGRNEQANTTGAGFRDGIRNTFVGMGGMGGLGKVQWKNLTDGLIQAIRKEV